MTLEKCKTPKEYLVEKLEGDIEFFTRRISEYKEALAKEGERHTGEVTRLKKGEEEERSRLRDTEKALEWVKKQNRRK